MLRLSLRFLPSLRRLSRLSRLPPPISPSPNPRFLITSLPISNIRDDLASPTISKTSNPWPEWSALLDNLRSGGFFSAPTDADDALFPAQSLPEDFLFAAHACLRFARDRPDLISLLSKKDIEVVVGNVSAFLFVNGLDSERRLRSFLGQSGGNVMKIKRACTVDVMRYLLSFACDSLVSSEMTKFYNRELVEASVRKLLNELALLGGGGIQESCFSQPMPRQFRDSQSPGPPFGQNREMRKWDWTCPRCNFMNFGRNVKCLECHEVRPNRQLVGGEWECPQCNFFNFARNAVCLKCDCKRPSETPYGAPGSGGGTFGEPASIGVNSNMSDTERRLVANEEKAERWFGKVSQMDASDMISATAGEDFPEIMPPRKGVNQFVASTRKTPLERRLENAQYGQNLGNNGSLELITGYHGESVGGNLPNKTEEFPLIRDSLDRILGRSSSVTEADKSVSEKDDQLSATITDQRFNSSEDGYQVRSQRTDTGYVPFVPLPADMFGMRQNSKLESTSHCNNSVSTNAGEISTNSASIDPISNISCDHLESLNGSLKEKEQADKSERWFKKVAELNDVTDLSSAVSDDYFPEIMPMRKGESRFVVSKKKDRSLISSQNKRRLSMEQSDTSNFFPFVPFPPNYFAKKDKIPEAVNPTDNAVSETSAPQKASTMPEKSDGYNVENGKYVGPSIGYQQAMRDETNAGYSTGSSYDGSTSRHSVGHAGDFNMVYGGNSGTNFNGRPANRVDWNAGYTSNSSNNVSTVGAASGHAMERTVEQPDNLQANAATVWGRGPARKEDIVAGPNQQYENTQNWRYSGKSLEGSLVKDPDPLDMSEEAKAERWFRRVAQIKDISELSQIPDEDFPSIMPMRKGVNRFVVSKRKTPLERRLTSPQYRRNLPIVSSDPSDKKDA